MKLNFHKMVKDVLLYESETMVSILQAVGMTF